jgi:hypothetical protein
MTAMAVDVAPGGGDQRVIAARYGGWFAPLEAEKVVDKTAGDRARGGEASPRSLPGGGRLGGGWGGDALIALKDNGITVVAFNGVEATTGRRATASCGFRNKRAEAVWRFREALDPEQEGGSVSRCRRTPS